MTTDNQKTQTITDSISLLSNFQSQLGSRRDSCLDGVLWDKINVAKAGLCALEAAPPQNPNASPVNVDHTDLVDLVDAKNGHAGTGANISTEQGLAAMHLLKEIRFHARRHDLDRDWLTKADKVLGTWGLPDTSCVMDNLQPEAWRSAPIQSTAAMNDAGIAALVARKRSFSIDPKLIWSDAEAIFAAMLAAAPQPAQPMPIQTSIQTPVPSADGPKELWLQLHGDCLDSDLSKPVDYTNDDVTWCWQSIHDSDVRYVRADLAQPVQLKEKL